MNATAESSVAVGDVVALTRTELAQWAPTYEGMRQAIERCQSVDEIQHVTNAAVAAQAYFRQSMDVENEIGASRIRLRAERRLGELLHQMRGNGERDRGGRRSDNESHGATLSDLGIPRDRASRAMQLADVPQAEFDAALGHDRVAQPRRILNEHRSPTKAVPDTPSVPIDDTLYLWGRVRDLGERLEAGRLPPLNLWRTNLQPFQLAHLRQHLPALIAYLSAIAEEINP
jgi:hypothetical protein